MIKLKTLKGYDDKNNEVMSWSDVEGNMEIFSETVKAMGKLGVTIAEFQKAMELVFTFTAKSCTLTDTKELEDNIRPVTDAYTENLNQKADLEFLDQIVPNIDFLNNEDNIFFN